MSWKHPPKAKVYEAMSAVADNRVNIHADFAEVLSSDRAKTYTVAWTVDRTAFGANDNASYWAGYMGYPVIATLIAMGRLPDDSDISGLFHGINWNALNKKHRRDYDAAVEEVLAGIKERGGDTSAIRTHVDVVYEALLSLDLGRIKPPGPPPKRGA